VTLKERTINAAEFTCISLSEVGGDFACGRDWDGSWDGFRNRICQSRDGAAQEQDHKERSLWKHDWQWRCKRRASKWLGVRKIDRRNLQSDKPRQLLTSVTQNKVPLYILTRTEGNRRDGTIDFTMSYEW